MRWITGYRAAILWLQKCTTFDDFPEEIWHYLLEVHCVGIHGLFSAFKTVCYTFYHDSLWTSVPAWPEIWHIFLSYRNLGYKSGSKYHILCTYPSCCHRSSSSSSSFASLSDTWGNHTITTGKYRTRKQGQISRLWLCLIRLGPMKHYGLRQHLMKWEKEIREENEKTKTDPHVYEIRDIEHVFMIELFYLEFFVIGQLVALSITVDSMILHC